MPIVPRIGLSRPRQTLGIEVARYRRGAEMELAASALGVSPDRVATVFVDLGREVGSRWRKEHRGPAAAAIGAC